MIEGPQDSGLQYVEGHQPRTPEVPEKEPEIMPKIPQRRGDPVIPPPPAIPEPAREPAKPKRERETEPA